MSLQQIKTESTKAIVNYMIPSTMRNILLGAGLSYSIQNEKYLHIPVVLLAPSIYTGYQMYKNKDKIAKWLYYMPV